MSVIQAAFCYEYQDPTCKSRRKNYVKIGVNLGVG